MEENKIYNEEQEKQLMERINEIKNQTAKENKNEKIEVKELLDNNNSTTGIENVVVYQNNAKKTMKGKKTKLIALIVAGGMLISGIGIAVANKLSQPTEAQLYQQRISSLLIEDETHKITEYAPGDYTAVISLPIDVSEHSAEEFATMNLYYGTYFNTGCDVAILGGYEPERPEDALCMYGITELSAEEEKIVFEEKDGYKYWPKSGYYIYKLTNLYTILVLEEYDPITGEKKHDQNNLGIAKEMIPISPEVIVPRNN